MTKRIAISILLTVWLVLILAGALSYLVTRSLLIADLDATLLARVSSLPSIERPTSLPAFLPNASPDSRDRYVLQNPQGHMTRPGDAAVEGRGETVPPPEIIGTSRFSDLPGGLRVRTITVKAFARRTSPTAPLVPVTIVYSGPADQLDAILTRLLLWLGGFGLIAGVATAAVAVIVAKTALLPLRATADVIGTITERNLDSRIPLEQLPVELKPVGLRLNELLARLETAFAQRRRFLGDASHELRTPVAALITTLEVTLHKKNRPTEDYLRALEVCLADARLLHQLVAALMDQVRAENFSPDSIAVDIAPVQLTAVLEHCAAIASTLANPRNIQLDLHLAPDVTALTDELKVRSIVTNLLSNAVEYTPAGGQVTLRMEVLPVRTGKGRAMRSGDIAGLPGDVEAALRLVRITVSDTGLGVSAEHLPHLFEPFYRADKSRTNPGQHLGLGLFLVRAQAISLGGDCHVESTAGRGACFVLRLPTAVLSSAEVAEFPRAETVLQSSEHRG